ncbi:MAG: Transcriptional attenuator, LytR family [Candidatus Woesebacteria bacterium GW2011_GWB1_38_5b]|uniref:Transcriptional attenuator, LytR family n=1 Tax=Candidatus Woesebacteria bacterium GW2011_GWB1_38_5b TaxID=1618569 RepID=A0A0G0NCY3_9BACT|nr:MAG: Transcriptional attenuator, LytR family [Candidatus Woesebacteria bacterium GW2011_GWB1_38_5b]OGH48268.1 MAG: hypothetical protein A3A51_00505 [Candidatus Levybacteria bacterium RIFCSPLOWO2_01_FULL_39_10]
MDDVSYSGEKKSFFRRFSKRSALIILILIIVLGLVGGVAYFATRETPGEEPKTIEIPDEETMEPEITEVPEEEDTTPTPAEGEIQREDISVSVQNGSGEEGVAGSAADTLRELGYDVVSTGNADNFEYENVTIQVKASQEDILPLLEEDLSESYTIGETSTDLPEDESFDALVIIGA